MVDSNIWPIKNQAIPNDIIGVLLKNFIAIIPIVINKIVQIAVLIGLKNEVEIVMSSWNNPSSLTLGI